MRLESVSDSWQEPPDDQACERVALLITRQIDGELAPEDARDLRLHLALCPDCRQALDAQSMQSKLLAKNLSALWKIEDRAAQKKKSVAAANVLRSNHRISKMFACAALASCVLFFSATVRAPSDLPARDISGHLPNQPILTSPQIAQSAPLALPVEKTETAKSADEVTDDDSIQNGPEEAEAVAELPAKNSTPEVPPTTPVAPVEVAAAPTIIEPAPFAIIAEQPPLKMLPGVSLSYSALMSSGIVAAGRVTLFGDILNEKGVVRIETSRGEIIEAAQTEIDTALTEPHHSAARKLLNACADEQHRKRIEQAIQKLND